MLRHRDPLANPEPLIRRVYAYAAYRLGAGPDAEDATNDTFERALRYRDGYDPRTGSAQAWLLGIARRVVDDHVARANTPPAYDVSACASADNEADIALIDRLSLREAMARLSQEERNLLALRYGADLGTRDIASITGARTNAVDVALHRAITKLRDRLSASAVTLGEET